MIRDSRSSLPGLALVAICAGLVLSSSLAPSSAGAQARPPSEAPSTRLEVSASVRARVEQALLVVEHDVPARFWTSLGAEGLAALIAIVDDPARPVGLRRRATYAARHYPTAASRTFLGAVATSRGQDELIARYAVLALGEAFGASALDELARCMSDPRAMVREGAVVALGRLSRELRARVLLAAARDREPEAFVRAAIERALAP